MTTAGMVILAGGSGGCAALTQSEALGEAHLALAGKPLHKHA